MSRSTAYRKGKKLLNRLKNTNWKLNVWKTGENFSFCLFNGFLTLYEHEYGDSKPKYSTLLSDRYAFAGNTEWYVNIKFDTPEEAIKYQIKVASDEVNRKLKMLTKLKKDNSKIYQK